ncbi:bifunctional diaminohydroxyphosphoribosylaminopyrimidine deaminase/5-amino-6-(5-phosphoribosylamino)uracil reductase RibD [[Haemophilus] felis]|uniref:Riboflavin biosynthesis protein RibD n=1 Tax=[Haemophilus] felis TaxID=123822 RepID=A0A1T0AQU7_9PAST|nr:bifunctional diaminohydroxyphosphoribosylaminopyrimidine deaminase/5-amino-6-(5-phosphoribosylamino)uracil reductase RibD [[Haemophilus] felis]NBI41749.1 bifunctional diaminohydroxyphosphoribosylaminopyrimidine deaminase/5-amino-6-(5-phosphoribosylamino)uracil reductase RibD [[Haemophilus] felis]OOR98687.1 riboflavin biosynthesis protein RibD [[Haemophilus] felis]
MNTFTDQDRAFMQRALWLAQQGEFTTTPNPSVGCVLVKKGNIVGEGFHFKAGEPHAEVMALRMAKDQAAGATAYVTLEPCSHFGRTPPCAKGLIEAGVSKVICAMRDPNPQVAGKGLALLEEQGIKTQVGLCEEQAEWLNRGFLRRMRTGLPFVRLKMAMSLDGRTAMANGESKWITSDLSRIDVQQERAKASAILSTSATVLADDPMLNVRWEQFPSSVQQRYPQNHIRQPVRIILDRQHLLSPQHKLFQQPSPIWLVSHKPRDLSAFSDCCEEILIDEKLDFLPQLMQELGKRQINSIWVEAGATLAGALIEAKLVDELLIYSAPKLLGDQARGLCKFTHLQHLADAPKWELYSVEAIGDDVKSVYLPLLHRE